MERTILHSDMNNFYASVECLYNPSLRDKPLAVGSQGDSQYGIILAKNYIAKKYKVGTGDAIWEAKRKCPGLEVVPLNFRQYMRFSKMAIKIYSEYTDKIESYWCLKTLKILCFFHILAVFIYKLWYNISRNTTGFGCVAPYF